MNIVAYKDIEYSRVLFSELNRDMRVDAEYFDPYHLRLEELEKKRSRTKIKSFAAVTDGIHDSIAFDDSSAINLISAKAPKENTFDLGGTGYISKKQHEKNPRTALQLEDVVISTVGTIGNCAVVEANILPANSDRHVGIIRIGNANVLPRYLSTYFVTKYGRSATKRETAGNVQPNLYIRNIADLAIPLPFPAFQKQIETLVLKAHQQKQLADKLYADAENLLLKELGLLDWKPDTVKFNLGGREFEVEDAISVGKANDIMAAERFDAEYFQPKFRELFKRISSIKHLTLHPIKAFSQSLRYGTSACLSYVDKGVPFLRIADLENNRFNNDTVLRISDVQASKLTERVAVGDVLISRSGTLGVAVPITPQFDNAVFGSYFIRTRPNSQIICPEYMAFFINSLAGQFQVEQRNSGGIQTNLTINAIENILIPVGSKDWQSQFTKIIQDSLKSRESGLNLLAQAKRAVELFIEEGEEVALKLLES